jgi:hypothetical protein
MKLHGGRDSIKHARIHEASIDRKRQRVKGLRALLEGWEAELQKNHTDSLHNYVLALRAKLRCAQNQLVAMGAELDEDFKISEWY